MSILYISADGTGRPMVSCAMILRPTTETQPLNPLKLNQELKSMNFAGSTHKARWLFTKAQLASNPRIASWAIA